MKQFLADHIIGIITALVTFLGANIVGFVYWLFLTFQTYAAAELVNIELQLQMAKNTIQVYETKEDEKDLDTWEEIVLDDAKWRVGQFTAMRQEAMGLKALPAPERPH